MSDQEIAPVQTHNLANATIQEMNVVLDEMLGSDDPQRVQELIEEAQVACGELFARVSSIKHIIKTGHSIQRNKF